MIELHEIAGAGGGKGGGGGSSRTPREEPNTLRSTSKARIIDALCEGPIVGLADGGRSIYLDDTPLQNEDGSYNFQGVTVHTRTGEPDQSHIAGFPAIETAHDVSAEVRADTPIVRTVGNVDANAVRVTIQIPVLTHQNKENGDLKGTRVAIAIDVQPSGGSWSEVRYDNISGKTTSPYQRTYRINLPGAGPWDLRVRRLTADSDESTLRNQTYWATYTEVIDAKLSYPDTALIGLEVDAQQFGNQVPSRSYDIKGMIVRVPSNYNPETRTYSGLWDGSFKLAWSDNPAWCFLDLATSERYGAGLENVDKWSLYQIAQYCDELVPDGYGADEPRFTFNTVLSSREDAISALATLASAFRGMTYWGANTVMATADMPGDPVKLVTPANVIDGEFEYAGTALKERHSVALVSWNDPADNYRLQVEVVEDADAIQQFGWRQLDVTAVGCTSRGQAHRLGKWMLASERAETETVTYAAGVDHADVRPGDIIALSDPTTAGARLGGRILQAGLQELELDAVPEAVSGSDWYLDALLPSGGIERRQVASFAGNRVTLASPLSAEPIQGAVWVLSSQAVEPRQFRALSVTEQDAGVYAITALEHDPTKYGRIELGLDLPEPDYSLIPTGPVVAPYNITVEPYTYLAGGTEHQGLTISWTPSDDARVAYYIADVQGPDDVSWGTAHNGPGTSFDILDAAPGQWMIRVRGVTGTGSMSPWVALTTHVAGLLLPTPPDAVDIETGTFSITLQPRGLYPGALWEFWRANAPLPTEYIESNAVRVAVATSLTDTDLTPDTQYYYYIRGVNAYGVSDWYPVQATTDNDPRGILKALTGEIREGHLYQALGERIDKIEPIEESLYGPESLEGSVAHRISLEREERIAALQGERDQTTAQITQEASARNDQFGQIVTMVDNLEAGLDEGYTAGMQMLRQSMIAADEALSQAIDSLTAVAGQNTADIITERDARATAIDAVASDVSAAHAAVGELEGEILEESRIRAREGDLLSGVQRVIAAAGETQSASLYTLSQIRMSEHELVIEQISRLEGQLGDTKGLISDESRIRLQENEALSERIDTTQAQLGQGIVDGLAAVRQETAAEVGRLDGRIDAEALHITTVQAQLGQDIASVEQAAEALISEQEDRINAMWTLRVDANGYVGGIGLANDGSQVDFAVRADRFYIAPPGSGGDEVLPFIVDGGSVYMREALIQSLTFTKLQDGQGNFVVEGGKLRAEYIQADQLVVSQAQSDNFSSSAGTGWRLLRNGSFEAHSGLFGGSLTASAINAVDTLNIRGNAVTLPASAITNAEVSYSRRTNTGYPGWTTVQELNFPSSGAPMLVLFSCRARTRVTGSFLSATHTVMVRFLVGNTEVFRTQATGSGGSWSTGLMNLPAFYSYHANHSAGNVRLRIQITGEFIVSYGGSVPTFHHAASRRTIFALETKR